MLARFRGIAIGNGPQTSRSPVLVFLILMILLIVFAQRTWGLGITIFDDAQWVLETQIPGHDPVRDFAVNQGRLWAFPVGSLMAHALTWQGTFYAETLKALSFVAFVISFHCLVAVYFNRRIAACTTLLYLSLSAVRWESINAYPLLNWPTLTAFALSVLAAHRYYSEGRSIWATISGILFLYSLFNNEGLSLLLFLLYATLVLATHIQFRCVSPLKTLSLAMVWIGVSALYVALALWWSRIHPTGYDGHKIAGFDTERILTVILHFSTSGSVLHEIFDSYRVLFSDTVQKTQILKTYDIRTALQDILAFPASIAVGGLVALAGLMIFTGRNSDRSPNRLGLAIAVGLIVSCVAIVPVAMTEKYQSYVFTSGVHGYQLSNFSNYGISLILSASVVSAIDSVNVGRRTMVAALALIIGALSALTSAQSSNMIADIRPEASRWKVLERVVEVAAANNIDIRYIWAPAFANGTWYAVLPATYWSEYARFRLGKEISLETDLAKLDTENGYAKIEYSSSRDRGTVVTLGHYTSGSADYLVEFSANGGLNRTTQHFILKCQPGTTPQRRTNAPVRCHQEIDRR
jgi:hypothetical protein